MHRSFYVGEGLAGDGNEIAHIDLVIGSKSGPAGGAFINTLSRQSEGHSNLLAVLAPNVAVKPSTVTFTKVTIKGAKQAVQMFGPAQEAVALAVADELAAGAFKDLGDIDEIVIVVGVFIHWEAAEDEKIFRFNYEATRMAIRAALKNGPTQQEVTDWLAKLEADPSIAHPFVGKFDIAAALKELRAKFVTV